MTAEELFKSGLAKIGETLADNAEEEANFAVDYINQCLAETFDDNNMVRTSEGMEELKEIPMLTAVSDTVPYEDRLVRRALPYKIASLYKAQVGDEMDSAAYYQSLYAAEARAAVRCVIRDIPDVYR